uniref:Squalene synthase n=1 Tax=Aegilops tauschii subsp. strangulata TaxID=200361 RepID=A0A453M5B0_AEGTS
RLFHATGTEDLAPDHLSNSMGLFLQKTNIIRDYLEDINEIPRCRMFWPREIWSKYVDKLEVHQPIKKGIAYESYCKFNAKLWCLTVIKIFD